MADGVGISINDHSDRLLIESFGEIDADHTNGDTLKIIERGIQCLKVDMFSHQLASFDTFKKRKILGLQYIGNKLSMLAVAPLNKDRWSCVLVRSAIIPRRWCERRNWIKVFELLLKMNIILEEQDALSDKILGEHTSGTISADKTIKHAMYNDSLPARPI